MQTPSKQPGSSEKLYEIPSCTICLQELVEDLSSLTCGHVFHLGCIGQHFQYRGTCPNCQKRASLKEVRTIHFAPVAKSNQAQIQINSVLSNLPSSEKNQMEALMNELKAAAQGSEKMKQKVASLQSDLRSKDKTVSALREEIYKHKEEGDKFIRENRKLSEAYKLTKSQLDQCVKSEEKLQKQNEKLRKEEREFEQMKRFKGLLQENSQEIVNYKQEMEAMSTPPQKMAKNFYEMLLMKNLELLRAKSRIKELLDIESEKNGEINRQRSTIESLRREMKEQSEKRANEQTKQAENCEKQRGIVDKTSKKSLKITDFMIDENSQSTANKNAINTESSMIQSTIRKPFFGHGSSTIGGFTIKKRDDKIKTTF